MQLSIFQVNPLGKRHGSHLTRLVLAQTRLVSLYWNCNATLQLELRCVWLTPNYAILLMEAV